MIEPNKMDFPDTFEEYIYIYGIKDTARIYTNGSILIPALRVKQWLEHIRPKGEWIGGVADWKCSHCGYGVFIYNNTDFCPNCGADMRGNE